MGGEYLVLFDFGFEQRSYASDHSDTHFGFKLKLMATEKIPGAFVLTLGLAICGSKRRAVPVVSSWYMPRLFWLRGATTSLVLIFSKGRSLVRRDAGTLDARTRHLLSQLYSSNNTKSTIRNRFEPKISVVTLIVLAHPASRIIAVAHIKSHIKSVSAYDFQSHSENPASQPHHQDPHLADLSDDSFNRSRCDEIMRNSCTSMSKR